MRISKKSLGFLKKGMEYVTIEKSLDNKGFFIYNRMKKRLSLNALQIKSTYNQLMNFGYKLRISKF